jgi:hypothetical protein
LSVLTAEWFADDGGREIVRAVDVVPAIGRARQAGMLTIAISTEHCQGYLAPGTRKRAIVELNKADGD